MKDPNRQDPFGFKDEFSPERDPEKRIYKSPKQEGLGDTPPETFLKPGMEVVIEGQARKWKVSGPVHKGIDDNGEGWFISVETILYGRRAKAAYRKELIESWNKGKA